MQDGQLALTTVDERWTTGTHHSWCKMDNWHSPGSDSTDLSHDMEITKASDSDDFEDDDNNSSKSVCKVYIHPHLKYEHAECQ